jgi:hypothetical protein
MITVKAQEFIQVMANPGAVSGLDKGRSGKTLPEGTEMKKEWQ